MSQHQRALRRTRGAGPPRRYTVAVIGAGASGTLTAVNLLKRHGLDLRVVLIDRAGHGPGIAYATQDRLHRLNVRASGMSAFDDDPDDLLRWCHATGVAAGPDDYLPRAVFGDYLRSLLKRFGDPGRLELVSGSVVDVEGVPDRDALRVTLADGRTWLADAAVLALGNGAPAPLAGVESADAYVPNPWAPAALAAAAEARRLVIVGSGLTAVDVALSASAVNRSLDVCLVSRHGWLPRVHARPPAPGRTPPLPPDGHGGLAALLAAIGDAVNADPSRWREVVDGLRPHANRLWQGLSTDDRRVFIRDFKSWWDVHRHRMAPQVGDELERLRRAGRLRVTAGAFHGARRIGGEVQLDLQVGSSLQRVRGDLLVNATGPSGPMSVAADPLVGRLLVRGDARPDALGLGFACDSDGRLLSRDGAPTRRLFTLGPPRRGELFESFAIPEIRTQAEALSRVLGSTDMLSDHRRDAADRQAAAY